MVDAFVENVKLYQLMWGQQGEPMVRSVEVWAEPQRAHVQWMHQDRRDPP
jgi:hypothetical protein